MRFNTQPPEGGCSFINSFNAHSYGFNTQPPEGGCPEIELSKSELLEFQHTAARKRLLLAMGLLAYCHLRFNTQPPEGGCKANKLLNQAVELFQHTVARRRLRQPGCF